MILNVDRVILVIIHDSMYVMYTCMSSSHPCMNVLKRKKGLEKQLQQIDGTLSTIEFQREALENAQTNTEVLKNMLACACGIKPPDAENA